MGLPAGERARSLTAAEAASGPWTEGRRDEVEEALPGGWGEPASPRAASCPQRMCCLGLQPSRGRARLVKPRKQTLLSGAHARYMERCLIV